MVSPSFKTRFLIFFYNEQLKKIWRHFFENPEKDFTLNVFLLLEFKCLWKMGISCSNISISITLKTFLKHTFQCQIASLLLLCKQGNVFCLFFQEQFQEPPPPAPPPGVPLSSVGALCTRNCPTKFYFFICNIVRYMLIYI